jgi:exodeoxyribonuclease VII large subunit
MKNQPLLLSELVYAINETIEASFGYEVFWIKAQISDVKKYESKKWCFLKFIEKQGDNITTEIKGNIWSNGYAAVKKFEQLTGTTFKDGLEIICAVSIRFHARYGLSLDVQDIEISHTIGSEELKRRETLAALVKNNPEAIQLVDEEYITTTKQAKIPAVIQHIALITANNSDGQRDFKTEIANNVYGYAFNITEFICTVQGENAHIEISNAIQKITSSQINFDCIAIVRGGGSQTDFSCFNEYLLAEKVALCHIPILTGIGHDRNTSIVDEMARQYKTPTKVASFIVEHNANYERQVLNTYEKIVQSLKNLIARELYHIQLQQNTIEMMHPKKILDLGYALIKKENEIITEASLLNPNDEIDILLKQHLIKATINTIS